MAAGACVYNSVGPALAGSGTYINNRYRFQSTATYKNRLTKGDAG